MEEEEEGECKGERERERGEGRSGTSANGGGVARDSADLLSFRISNAPGLRRMHSAR